MFKPSIDPLIGFLINIIVSAHTNGDDQDFNSLLSHTTDNAGRARSQSAITR
jgi:hypothetical protein